MNNRGSQAQKHPKGRDIAQISPLKRFFENSPKKAVIIVNIEGCLLNGDQEIPNSSYFLNMMHKEFHVGLEYLSIQSSKESKTIYKALRNYKLPLGELHLVKKGNFANSHIHSTLTNLNNKYKVVLVITSDAEIHRFSKKLGINVILTKLNTEWDHSIRRRIIRVLESSYYQFFP